LTYRERVDEPWIHYVYPDCTYTHAVIVEDWFSAQKVADAGALGIALLGTHLNRDRVDEIKQVCAKVQTIIALDQDAYAKAIEYVLEFGGELNPPMKVGRLKQDLKYVDKDVIKAVLDEGRTDFTGGNTQGSKLL
jgi:DNA primase